MEKLTGKQIIEILKKEIEPHEFGHNELDLKKIKSLGLGECTVVYDERDGAEFDVSTMVQHFKDHDVYILLSGYYSSQDGSDFSDDDYRIVRPKEKTIIIYEEEKKVETDLPF